MRKILFACVMICFFSNLQWLFAQDWRGNEDVETKRQRTAQSRRNRINLEEVFDDPKVIELCRAIGNNSLEEVKKIIDQGVNINCRGKSNFTPLMYAIYSDIEIIEFLLKSGADPNVVTNTWYFDENSVVESENSLPFTAFYFGMDGISVIHFCTRNAWEYEGHFLKLLKLFLKHGGNPNLPDVYNFTPLSFYYMLHLRQNKWEYEVTKTLAEAGADVNYINTENKIKAADVRWNINTGSVHFSNNDKVNLLLLEHGKKYPEKPYNFSSGYHYHLVECGEFLEMTEAEAAEKYGFSMSFYNDYGLYRRTHEYKAIVDWFAARNIDLKSLHDEYHDFLKKLKATPEEKRLDLQKQFFADPEMGFHFNGEVMTDERINSLLEWCERKFDREFYVQDKKWGDETIDNILFFEKAKSMPFEERKIAYVAKFDSEPSRELTDENCDDWIHNISLGIIKRNSISKELLEEVLNIRRKKE